MGHCILKVKFNKEDRILDDTAPGIVSKYTVDFEYDSKKNPFMLF
jgi:hypothetical protein